MRIIFVLAALFLATAICAEESHWSGNTNFFLGAKSLDKSDWAPVESQAEFGVLVDFKQTNWPVSIAIDFMGARSEKTAYLSGTGDVDVIGVTSELNLGVRKVWESSDSKIRPYVGGGLALVSAEVEVSRGYSSATESDNGVGVWLNGGVYWTLNESFNLGFDVRYSTADVNIGGVDADAGGGHLGLLLGYHW